MPDPNNDRADFDDQSPAETFDEENITRDGRDIATSDMQRDVFDATSVDEDADAALEPEDDWDPDTADEAEVEQVVRADEDLDEPRSFGRDDDNLVAADDPRPADFESETLSDDDLEALGYEGDDAAEAAPESDADARLDESLKETFPASDPVAVNPRSD